MSTTTLARRIAKLLAAADRKVVFAESCTGGLVSGVLTSVPGISNHHCGGVIVYREQTKIEYLGIDPELLAQFGAVSPQIAEAMAKAVLTSTPEADTSLSITGHLGPKAPPEQDGVVYVAIAQRPGPADVDQQITASSTKLDCSAVRGRVRRQRWVVEQALSRLAQHMAAPS